MTTTIRHVKSYSILGNRFARFELRTSDGLVLQTVDILVRDKRDVFEMPLPEAKEQARRRFGG